MSQQMCYIMIVPLVYCIASIFLHIGTMPSPSLYQHAWQGIPKQVHSALWHILQSPEADGVIVFVGCHTKSPPSFWVTNHFVVY